MELDFGKGGGLIPAIVQDAADGTVLMLGFMNETALQQTRQTGKVTFYSRSRQKLWVKGETSGNVLEVKDIAVDCDGDALLIKAVPAGPTCHTGERSCFGNKPALGAGFLRTLERIIDDRKRHPTEGSYTCQLMRRGLPAIAQKVGEEATELVVAALAQDETAVREEAADLLFHTLLLLREKNVTIQDVAEVLEKRHTSRTQTRSSNGGSSAGSR